MATIPTIAALSAPEPITTNKRGLIGDSPTYQATRRLLPKAFHVYKSEHYIVLSNADVRWTKAQMKRLERTHQQFQRYASRLGLKPDPLRHKLVGVMFQDRRTYSEFGRTHDKVVASWNYGYYAPSSDRLVLFNGETDQNADEFSEKRTVATSVHEAIHQLHYHTKLQNKHVQYPLWSGEGLATCFETSDTNEPFGPEHEFDPRRSRFERLLKRDSLMPLRDLVQLDAMPDKKRETVFTIYNQSYALLGWLARNKRTELRTYLTKMRQLPPGRPERSVHLDIFTQCFGPPESVEKEWLLDEIERTETKKVAGSLILRLNSVDRGGKETILRTEPVRIVEGMENDERTNGCLDDFDVARTADGVQHLSSVPGAEAPQD
ncbi:MAG: DUF1570 domain-containing protein [Planctomycetota bacterium]|nr:DUF1570 domain-containing protein [Planctomycetota bacterium]